MRDSPGNCFVQFWRAAIVLNAKIPSFVTNVLGFAAESLDYITKAEVNVKYTSANVSKSSVNAPLSSDFITKSSVNVTHAHVFVPLTEVNATEAQVSVPLTEVFVTLLEKYFT